jgi:hypothetical protein
MAFFHTMTLPLFSTPRPTKSATNNNKIPPKQQKLFFGGESSSSGKRPRENSPFQSQSGGPLGTIGTQKSMKPSTFTPTTSKCKSIPSRQQSRRSSKRCSRQLYSKTPQLSSYKSRLTNLFLALLPRLPLFFKWGNSLCTLNKIYHPARQGSTKTSRHSHLHPNPGTEEATPSHIG